MQYIYMQYIYRTKQKPKTFFVAGMTQEMY